MSVLRTLIHTVNKDQTPLPTHCIALQRVHRMVGVGRWWNEHPAAVHLEWGRSSGAVGHSV